MERKLVYIPMLHNPLAGEMLPGPELDNALAHINPALSQQFEEEQNKYWDQVDRYLESFRINKIYHDSFIDTISAEIFLNSLSPPNFRNKSRNARAINTLLDKGAVLMPTESERCVTAYAIIGDIYIRDKYIAENISRTLPESETAVFFIGAFHNVDRVFEKSYPDIEVCKPKIDISTLVRATEEFCLQLAPRKKVAIELQFQSLLRKVNREY